MTIRKALAAWLDPQMAKDARRYTFLDQRISEASDWLGADFPLVNDVVRWAKVSTIIHFGSLSSKPPEHVLGKPWIHAIHDFRQHLREKYENPA